MSREKGQPKTGGREKGTPNRITKDVRQWVYDIIQENTDTLENDLKSLEPKERWQIINGLLPYIIDKKQPNRYFIFKDTFTGEYPEGSHVWDKDL